MIEESLNGELCSSFMMECYYHEDFQDFRALFLRPLLKKDNTWYLINVWDEFGTVSNLNDKHINRLKEQAMAHVGFLFAMRRRIFVNELSMEIDENEWVPMSYRIAEEPKELIEEYITFFCEWYLKKEINKKISCDVKFDKEASTILFIIPFTDYSPAIHINTVLYNWDSTVDFINDIINSLKKLFPSKNTKIFE